MDKEKFFTHNWAFNFVILLPIINAIATLFTGFFAEDSIMNPGVIRGLLIVFFSIYFFIKRFPHYSLSSKFLFFFLIYTFLLCAITNNPKVSLNTYMKLYVSTVLFLLGCSYPRSDQFLKKISITILIYLGILIINFLISNYFKIGVSSYKGAENELYFGNTGINLAKLISAIILMAPVFLTFFENRKQKMFIRILIFMGVMYILFAFKRSAILGLVIGYFIFFITNNDFKKNTKQLATILFVLLIFYPVYYDQVKDNFNSRKEAIYLNDEENLEKQARYQETQDVMNAFEHGSLKHKLFGSELFNDREFFQVRRMLHTDYMNILNGTGIIGSIIFFLTYFFIYRELKFNRAVLKSKDARLYFSVGLSLIVGLIFYGFAGTIMSIEPRGTILFFLGAITGASKHKILAENWQKRRLLHQSIITD
jgi:hypothetical protein